MVRFLPGLILIQAASIGLILFVVDMTQPWAWLKILAVLAILTLIISFWFDSMAAQQGKDAVANLSHRFARERERIKIHAEREKSKVVQDSQKELARASARVHSRANLKVGASLSGAAGFGVLMLVTEFITLGLLTLFTAGGAMGGYLLRGKQQTEQGRNLKVIKENDT